MNQQHNEATLPALQMPQRTVLSEEIYNSLRSAILNGTLEAGTRIVEESIARQMGVSRAPLREALSLLRRDGLLREESARDTRVIALTQEDIRELHLIRTMLETLAYQHAARLLEPQQVAQLEELIDGMEQAAAAGDDQAMADLDYRFHQILVRASGLPRVYRIWDEQHILFRLWLNVVARHHDGDAQQIVASHRAILVAIAAKDDSAIAEQVLDHVYRVGSAMAEERDAWAAQYPRSRSH